MEDLYFIFSCFINFGLDVERMKVTVILMKIVRVVLFVEITIVWIHVVLLHFMMKRMTAVKELVNQIIHAKKGMVIVRLILIVRDLGCIVETTIAKMPTFFPRADFSGTTLLTYTLILTIAAIKCVDLKHYVM